MTPDDVRLIDAALAKAEGALGAAKELLGGRYEYGLLRLYCAFRARGGNLS